MTYMYLPGRVDARRARSESVFSIMAGNPLVDPRAKRLPKFTGSVAMGAAPLEGKAWKQPADTTHVHFLNAPYPSAITSAYSLFLLCRVDAFEAWGVLLDWSDGTNNSIVILRENSTNSIRIVHQGVVAAFHDMVPKVATGNWVWLAATWPGTSGQARMYAAGVQASNTNALATAPKAPAKTDQLVIGGYRTLNSSFEVQGDFAALYILPYEVSAAEVRRRSAISASWDWLQPNDLYIPSMSQSGTIAVPQNSAAPSARRKLVAAWSPSAANSGSKVIFDDSGRGRHIRL